MRARNPNPFLAKPQTIKWRTGPSAVGRAALQSGHFGQSSDVLKWSAITDHVASSSGCRADNSGDEAAISQCSAPSDQDPKSSATLDPERKSLSRHTDVGAMYARRNGTAGGLAVEWDAFLSAFSSGWGSNLDMLALAHGAVGCGAFALTERLNLPGFTQGIDSFTALHACTDLNTDDLKDNGDKRLELAIDEAHELFPLARGLTVINEEPVGLIGTNVQRVVKLKTEKTGRLVVARSYGLALTHAIAKTAALKAASQFTKRIEATPYDVVLAYGAKSAGLIWTVSKLLCDIGLNPVHERTGSSSTDMARIQYCKLIVAPTRYSKNVPSGAVPGSTAHLQRSFGTPLIAACFVNPTATDASLRAIASHFDESIQRRAEEVIASNRIKIETVIARYRPSLEGKLFLNLGWLSEDQLKPFKLLGMRTGDAEGWLGKTGVPRVPRLAWKWNDTKSFNSYIAEAKPDVVFQFNCSEPDWHKRGLAAIPLSSLFDLNFQAFWGYDGFAQLAVALDRHINAPWRKLVKPPWAKESG